MKGASLKTYLQDPFLAALFDDIRAAGNIKSSLLDITHKCNLRCVGCYYFMEEMDQYKKEKDDDLFDAFIEQEVARGINMLTIVGGEPALEVDRLRKLAQHFKLTVVTNGSMPIPMEGLENIRIAISFWGDKQQDTILRGKGTDNIFEKALHHFRNDQRAGFYYTTVAGFTDGIAEATAEMIENGNFVTYNFYADLASQGNEYTHKNGFSASLEQIQKMTERYPDRIISSPYINSTIASRQLLGMPWGYQACPSVTFDHPENAERMATGKKYPTQFRAYNADLKTTRRCCIGQARDCNTCTDLWATYGWVIGSMKEHLHSEEDFSNWLMTSYIFYMQTGFIHMQSNADKLPEMYRRFRNNTQNAFTHSHNFSNPSIIPLVELQS